MKIRASVAVFCLILAGATVSLAHNGFEHVMGTVTGVTANSVTVQTVGKEPKAVTVSTLPSTKYMKSGAAASMKDLKVGDRVMIEAKENAAHSLEAASVTFGKQPAPQPKPAQ